MPSISKAHVLRARLELNGSIMPISKTKYKGKLVEIDKYMKTVIRDSNGKQKASRIKAATGMTKKRD